MKIIKVSEEFVEELLQQKLSDEEVDRKLDSAERARACAEVFTQTSLEAIKYDEN